MSLSTTPATRAASRYRGHAPALAVAVAAVVLLHSLVLDGLGSTGAAVFSRTLLPVPTLLAKTVPLHARQIARPAPKPAQPGAAPATTASAELPVTPAAPATFATQAQRQPQSAQPPTRHQAAKELVPEPAPLLEPGPAPHPNADSAVQPENATTQQAALDVALDAALDAPLEAAPTPLYTTQPAPAATLHYELRRGPVQGQARLRWQPQGSSYQLQLQFQALGAPLLGWASSGQFDAHGLAPERYSELRRGREVRAANFQRDAQTLSFSAQSAVWPLPSGIQDRSSWMLQLAAVLQANPQLAEIGGQVTLTVVGTRGRPEPWTFTVLERGNLDTPAGPVADAVQLLREPRRPYDTRATVWLDPARHHLPVQLHLDVHGTHEGQRWRLLQLQWD